jgi:hypothetical protein
LSAVERDNREARGRSADQCSDFVCSNEKLTAAGLNRRASFWKQLFEEVGVNNFTDFDDCISAGRLSLRVQTITSGSAERGTGKQHESQCEISSHCILPSRREQTARRRADSRMLMTPVRPPFQPEFTDSGGFDPPGGALLGPGRGLVAGSVEADKKSPSNGRRDLKLYFAARGERAAR